MEKVKEHIKNNWPIYLLLIFLLILLLYPFLTKTTTDKTGTVISTSKISLLGALIVYAKYVGTISFS